MNNALPQPSYPPRLLRLREAPRYLGMDRNRFNSEVRPLLTEIPLGEKGVAFDRLELDVWVDHYVSRNGRRPKASKLEDDVCQNATKCRASASKAESGKLRNAVKTPKVAGSAKARDALAALRQKKS
mgnify:CR=1 FL=1